MCGRLLQLQQRYHAAIQVEMVLEVDGMWPWPLQKGQNALTYFSVFRFQYGEDLT